MTRSSGPAACKWFAVGTLMVAAAVPASAAFDSKAAPFTVAFHGEVTHYRDAAVFAMPGESLTFEVVDGPNGDYTLAPEKGTVAQVGTRKWRWLAPQKTGVYDLRVEGPRKKLDLSEKKESMALHVFVMVPASDAHDGVLNGYKIGTYPAKPLKGNPLYIPPPAFVEVTKGNEDTKLSPHFRLKQFVCKEGPPSQYPKYLVLHERLPIKLETVLALVNQMGFEADTLHVMSGYRTPFYNHAIGDVLYSMHQWGRAADVFVDVKDKGVMDDLNHDGRVDIADSKYLYDAAERLLAQPQYQYLQGGMGYYPTTSSHPPFVHFDVRGTKARWKG